VILDYMYTSIPQLVQIEHALAAVNSGATCLGIKGGFLHCPACKPSVPMLTLPTSLSPPTATNAIVLAVEKSPPSPLVDTTGLEKLAIICPNIGMVYSGMGPDFRVLVARARKSAQAYWKIYGEYPPTRVLVQEVAAIMQEATQRG
jgi:20S proteasome subunit alpha 2